MDGTDYSGIRPLGGYPAAQCPVRLQYDRLPPEGTVAGPPSPAGLQRMADGRTFEDEVLDRLAQLHPEALLVEGPGAVEATLEALRTQVPLVLGAQLPPDPAECRTGHPDVLLLDGDGYVPVDVKLHTLTTTARGSAYCSSLEQPWREQAAEVPTTGYRPGREHDDALQLAHYWRMLERLGHASSGPARGGIIDRSAQLWWIALEEPACRVWWQGEKATWLERYDHEFDFRRDVALHTQRRIDGEPLEPKVVPVWVAECRTCPWRDVCHAELEEVDHVSLLPGTTWSHFVEHRRRGVLTRRALAGLDPFTARLLEQLTPTMCDRVEAADEGLALADVGLRNRDALVDRLAADGIGTAGALRARLDDRTWSYRDARLSHLADRIDLARAAVSGPHRRRGIEDLPVPDALIEVDVDMECDPEGRVYLWGLLPSVGDAIGEYVALDSYAPMTAEVEAQLLVDLLDRLADLREVAAADGGALRVHHWSPAELTAMRRIVAAGALPGLPTPEELEAMVEAEWVDLHDAWKAAVITGSGSSIKTVAPLVGFTWAVDDPGGDLSMLKYLEAVEGDPGAVDWLRSYNGDDVRATFEIRRWLRAEFATLPRIEDWTPADGTRPTAPATVPSGGGPA